MLSSTVTDLAGNRLDGEIAAPRAPAFPSGDGVAGGPAVIQFTILQGDVNDDDIVDADDLLALIAALGTCAGDAGYNPGADLNGDACINVLDIHIFVSAPQIALPELGDPPFVTDSDPAAGPLPLGSDTFTVFFDQPISALAFPPDAAYLQSLDGDVTFPNAATLAPGGLSATFDFKQRTDPCDDWALRLSNAIATETDL